MKSSLSMFNDEDSLMSQAKDPSQYSILKHDMNEISNIPIDPNLLLFKEKMIRFRYFNNLYFNSTETEISKEFKYNLMSSYIFLTLYLVIDLSVALSLYYSCTIPVSQLYFHVSAISLICVYAYSVLFFVLTIKKVVYYNRILFAILGLGIYLYMILGDSQVISGITGDTQANGSLPMSIGIVAFTYNYRRLLFDSYRYLIFTLFPVLILYLFCNLMYSNQKIFSIAGEFTMIASVALFQITESHIVENRSIQLFYRMEKELELSNENKGKNYTNHEGTEATKSIIKKCDFIISEINYAISVIIFQDVKNRLKTAQSEMSSVRNKVKNLEYFEKFEFYADDLDYQDREFIDQNYLTDWMNVTRSGSDSGNQKDAKNIKLQQNTTLSVQKSFINDILENLSAIGLDWDINVFEIQENTGHSISIVALYIYSLYSLGQVLNVTEDTFYNFFESLEKAYKLNPYHNALHGADVYINLEYFIQNTDICSNIKPLDNVCTIIAGLGHDVGHPGLTNRFLVKMREKIAIQYNDFSVLESMHCSIIFSLMTNDTNNILSELKESEWIECRKIIISMILQTDLSKHFEILNNFRTRSTVLNDLIPDKYEDKILILSMALKCADIGHSAKKLDTHKKWSQLVMEEYFLQGDFEKSKGLPVSAYCDRNSTSIPKSQLGFIKNICLPMYEIWYLYTRSTKVNLCLSQLHENFEYWDKSFNNRKISELLSMKEESL